jgi:glutaredoxin 3
MRYPGKIRLFIKPFCGWCHEVMDWLDRRQIDYEKLDVTRNTAAWREMMSLSGQTRAPVIDVDGQVLADFGAEELEYWWQAKGFGFPGDQSKSQLA